MSSLEWAEWMLELCLAWRAHESAVAFWRGRVAHLRGREVAPMARKKKKKGKGSR